LTAPAASEADATAQRPRHAVGAVLDASTRADRMFLNLVILGVVITLEPIPLTTFILLLASTRGVRKGAAFIVGWVLSLVIVIASTILVTGDNPPKPSTVPSVAALVVKLIIGLALLGVAVRQRRRMGGERKPKKVPKWQTGIDNMSLWFAFGLGPLTQPWGLLAVGVAVIVEAKVSSWESYIALFLFAAVATSSFIALEILAGVRPEQAQATIARIRTWIDSHTDQVIIVLSLVLGVWLVGSSIYYLVT
jgi:hypothetical protein